MVRVSRSVPVTLVLALVVTAGALLGSWELRTPGADTTTTPGPPSDNAQPCVTTTCQVAAAASTGGQRVELRATPSGTEGAIAIAGTSNAVRVTVTTVGARLSSDSLECVQGDSLACMVSGDSAQGRIGEVFLYGRGGWDRIEQQYASPAGVLGLRMVDGQLSVVLMHHACGSTGSSDTDQCNRVYAEVFSVSGGHLGCTQYYASKYDLPGWPEIAPRKYQLRTCPQL